jgi:hypothetical protein
LLNASRSTAQDFGLPAHYRPRQWSAVWDQPPIDWRIQLAEALERIPSSHAPAFFFRADDIGAGGQAFRSLCQLFRHHRAPLAMAVIPAWLSAIRTEQLFAAAPLEEPLWGWHQHGWRHANWQQTGKKSEFGEERPVEKQWSDICRGLKKMTEIFGNRLTPVFTPPWNRLPSNTLRILQELDFQAVSTAGALPRISKSASGLKNLRIHLDLHTRKEKDGNADFLNLLSELSALMARKGAPAGIMLHHQRMTPFAFEFLDELLHLLKHQVRSQVLSFAELLENAYDE